MNRNERLIQSAGRIKAIEEVSEQIVTAWVTEETTPPQSLAQLVSRYRDLDFYISTTEDDPDQAYQESNAIWDKLIASVVYTAEEITHHAEQRLRSQERRQDHRSYSEHCSIAIERFRQGVKA